MSTIPEDLAALVDHPLARASVGQFLNIVTSKLPNPYYKDAGDDEDDKADADTDTPDDTDGKNASGYGKWPGALGAMNDMTDQAPKHLSPTVQQILNGHVKWFDLETLMPAAST
jgi:hypothetical protein